MKDQQEEHDPISPEQATLGFGMGQRGRSFRICMRRSDRVPKQRQVGTCHLFSRPNEGDG